MNASIPRGGAFATVLAFILLWVLMDRSAALSGSLRGEAGLLVCAIVVAAALACERALAGGTFRQALASLGLRAPSSRAILFSLLLAGSLLLYFPLFSAATGSKVVIRPDAALLAVGMFAQGGVAEEVVFRGFLFRRLREGRSFWRAASLAAVPFAAVHALLFLTLDFPLALASFLLAVSLSFPMAWLFEASGNSILPPAILHAVVQAAIKVVETEADFVWLATGWMVLGGAIPWLAFLLKSSPQRNSGERKALP